MSRDLDPAAVEMTELVLVVEDLEVPISKPAVHCLVLVDPSRLDSPTCCTDPLSPPSMSTGLFALNPASALSRVVVLSTTFARTERPSPSEEATSDQPSGRSICGLTLNASAISMSSANS